ncbi:MAG: AtpZ/AtpI family protein [Anaerolineales bacterium]|nr:AtpZ/AtpI family protein [Anaerolineales bacterium]
MKKYLSTLEGYHLALQISSILLCSVFGSLFGGIWLDRKLGTTPWLTLILMVVGLVIATYIIYRTVKEPH